MTKRRERQTGEIEVKRCNEMVTEIRSKNDVKLLLAAAADGAKGEL